MNYPQLVQFVIGNTTDSLRLFLPELVVCRDDSVDARAAGVQPVGAIHACWWRWWAPRWRWSSDCRGSYLTVGVERHEIFTGMLVYDNFTVFFRGVLLLFGVLFIVFTRISGIPDRDDAADFYTLSLGATLGMMLMASANHLLIIFLGVEMASVPSYVLAGMLKGRRRSSEAALKYSVYGAGAAGVMLYGISLLAGVLGSCHLPTMALRLSTLTAPGTIDPNYMVLVLGGLMVMVGLAFKLSAVPFHFWCPDVFEGASAEVNAFLPSPRRPRPWRSWCGS